MKKLLSEVLADKETFYFEYKGIYYSIFILHGVANQPKTASVMNGENAGRYYSAKILNPNLEIELLSWQRIYKLFGDKIHSVSDEVLSTINEQKVEFQKYKKGDLVSLYDLSQLQVIKNNQKFNS